MTSAPESPQATAPLDLQLDDFEETMPIGFTIAGVFYRYSNVDSWGLIKRQSFGSIWKRIDALENKENATARDEAEYERFTREAIQLIAPDVSDEILSQMRSPTKRMMVMMDFFVKLGERNPLIVMLRSQAKLTGQISSPVSISSGRRQTRKSG